MPLSRPPLLTLLQEILGWTLDRTADLPKSQRFTFGQRLDGLTLDALLLVQRAAVTADRAQKAKYLGDLSVLLEQLNLLWELVHHRRWISGRTTRPTIAITTSVFGVCRWRVPLRRRSVSE